MRTTRLTLVLAAALLLPALAHATPAPMLGQFAVAATSGAFQVQLAWDTPGNASHYAVSAERLGSLVADGLWNSQETPVRFTLHSEAGQVSFVGTARNGRARGRFSFDPSESFAAQIERRVLDDPSDAQLLALALSGTTLADVDALAARLAGRVARPQAVELLVQNITAADLDAFAAVGYRNLTAADLLAFKARGIDAAQVARLQAMGYARIQPGQVVRLHDAGATQTFIEQANTGRAVPRSVDQLVRLSRATGR